MTRVAHAVFHYVVSASVDRYFAVDVDSVDLDADGIQKNTVDFRDNAAARHDFDITDYRDRCCVDLQDDIAVEND